MDTTLLAAHFLNINIFIFLVYLYLVIKTDFFTDIHVYVHINYVINTSRGLRQTMIYCICSLMRWVLEWVSVNWNAPNTKMVDFNHAQNCEKKFFRCSTGICETCLKQDLHMANSILFHHVMWGRWIVLFLKSHIFPKMANYSVKQ